MTKITVIMTTYNQAYYIDEAIKSVINQDFDDWQLSIINDGCTDRTQEVVEEFLGDPRIMYILNEENKGQPYSRNMAVKWSEGDYICVLDSDDIMLEGALRRYVEYMDTHPDVDVYVVGAIKLFKDGTEDKYSPLDISNILKFNPFCHQATVVKKECYKQDPKFLRSTDYEMWLRLFYEGKKFVRTEDIVPFVKRRIRDEHPEQVHYHNLALAKWKDKIIEKGLIQEEK